MLLTSSLSVINVACGFKVTKGSECPLFSRLKTKSFKETVNMAPDVHPRLPRCTCYVYTSFARSERNQNPWILTMPDVIKYWNAPKSVFVVLSVVMATIGNHFSMLFICQWAPLHVHCIWQCVGKNWLYVIQNASLIPHCLCHFLCVFFVKTAFIFEIKA